MAHFIALMHPTKDRRARSGARKKKRPSHNQLLAVRDEAPGWAIPTNFASPIRQPAACDVSERESPRWAEPAGIPRDDKSFRSAQETFATLRLSRQVFWLPDRPTGRAFPRLARSGSCGGRSRLQRRDRNGFAPFSLFFPRGDKPPEHLASGRNVAQRPDSSRRRLLPFSLLFCLRPKLASPQKPPRLRTERSCPTILRSQPYNAFRGC